MGSGTGFFVIYRERFIEGAAKQGCSYIQKVDSAGNDIKWIVGKKVDCFKRCHKI